MALMPDHLKPFQSYVFFVRVKSCLLLGDEDLILNGVNTVQIGKQETAAAPFGNNDAVFLHIQLRWTADPLRGTEDVDGNVQFFQFLFADRREPRVPGGRTDGVRNDFFRYTVFRGLDGSNAAAERTVLVQGDKRTGLPFGQFGRQPVGRNIGQVAVQGDDPVVPDKRLNGFARQFYIYVLGIPGSLDPVPFPFFL